eukprot:Hpha_TRINITY_DN10216_c0_g1::TRINITY_DN10216_c0_g1_i1::g.35066::m.35066
MPVSSQGGVVYSHNVFDPARPVKRRNSCGGGWRSPESPTLPGSPEAVELSQLRVSHADHIVTATAAHRERSKEYLPRVLGNDPTLTKLHLQASSATDVSVGSLADSLRANTVVTSVDLRGNLIEAPGAHAIAECLTVNTKLTSLDLSDNGISSLGCVALVEALKCNNSITSLSVDGNALVNAKDRAQLQTLVTLNQKPPDLKAAVLAVRSGGPRIIDLSYDPRAQCQAGGSPAEQLDCWAAEVLAEALVGNRTVEVLNMCDQHVADRGARAFAEMLRRNEKLDRLNLFANAVTDEGCRAIIAALEANNTCTVVNLKSNGASQEILWKLEVALALNRQPLTLKRRLPQIASNDPDLISLQLNEHASCRSYDDTSARLISDAISENDNLTSLDLSQNSVGAVGSRFLADALLRNTSLKVLDLSRNPVGGEGAAHLAAALRDNRTLVILKLISCQVDDKGAVELAAALGENQGLTQLDLSENPEIGDSGQAFVRALQVNTGLGDLRLEGTTVSAMTLRALEETRALNQEPPALRAVVPRLYRGDPDLARVDLSNVAGEYPLSDSSCTVLSPVLQTSYVLTDLDLSGNSITTKGVHELCFGLTANRFTLKRLNLSRNSELDYEAARALCGVLRTHQALTSIDLSHNRLLDAGGEELYNFCRLEPGSSQLLDLNIEGNRMEPHLARRLQVLVKSHSCLPGVKTRILKFFSGGFKGDSVLNFSELEAFVDPETPEQLFDDAAKCVAMAVEGATEYTGISFRFNRLGDAGLGHLADLLRTTPALTSLDASNNKITDAGVEALLEVVQERPDLGMIGLDGNKLVSEEMIARLRHDMHFNRQPDSLKRLLFELFKNDPASEVLDCSHLEGNDQISDSRLTYLCEALLNNTAVRRIDFSHNHLTADGARLLFDTLAVTTHITSVSLRNNVLEGVEPAEALAALLGRDQCGLTAVDLSHNDIPVEAGPILVQAAKVSDTLFDLRLAGNRINAHDAQEVGVALALNRELEVKKLVPRLAASDPGIEEVDLAQRDVSELAVYAVCAALRGTVVVEVIDLTGNPRVGDHAAVNYLAPLLADNGCPLTRLTLARTSVRENGAVALVESLLSNTTLQKLDLQGCSLGDSEAVVEAAEGMLRENTIVLELGLADTGLTEAQIQRVDRLSLNGQPLLRLSMPRLRANDPQLTALDFSVEPEMLHTDISCRLLTECSLHNAHLTSLNLSGTQRVTDEGASQLAVLLHQSLSLTELRLHACAITDDGAIALATALRVNGVLRVLDLSKNLVADAGVRAIAKSLAASGFGNDTLRVCDVQNNPDLGDAALAELEFELVLNNGPTRFKHDRPLIVASAIERLDYSDAGDDRPLTDQTVELLVDCVLQSSSVRSICLRNNKIEWNGAERLGHLLRNNTTMTELDIAGNRIGAGSTMLLDGVRRNWTVNSLSMGGNESTEYDVERIRELVQLNDHPRALKTAVILSADRDPSQLNIVIRGDEPDEAGQTRPLTDEGLSILAEHLRTDAAATRLTLSHNTVGDKGACALAATLAVNREITVVDLAHNEIGDVGAGALAEVMRTHPLLSSVDLSYNRLTPPAAEALVMALRANANILQCRVDGNPELADEDVDKVQLFETLNHKSTDFRELFHRVADCDPELSDVNMEGWVSLGHYDGNSVELVAEAVALNPRITSLNMAFCDVTDSQLKVLSELVKVASGLKVLELSNNKLTSDIGCLTSAVAESTSLTCLSLRDNRVGLEGAKLVATMLRENDTLVELDLSGNTFGEVGVKIMSEGLKMNDSVQQIFVEGQGVSKQAQQQLELAIDLSYRSVAPAADLPAESELSPPSL